MKRSILLLNLGFCIFLKAQNMTPGAFQSSYSSTLSINSLGGDHAVFGVKSDNLGKSLKYDEIIGSPYVYENFIPANVNKTYENTSIRYNSYSDEIEFKKDGSPLVLPKNKDFSRIEIESNKQTIVLLDTKDKLEGYFFEILAGKNILYKKIKTKFIDMVPAANSYATDKPASFKTLDPIYYIKTAEDTYIKNPKNQKDLIQQMPDKKDVLTSFFKENKIKFDKEEDMKKLVTFLNQN